MKSGKSVLNKHGFTLIEVVITILILAVVFEILAAIVTFSTKFFREENSQLDNQNGIRLVYLEIEKDLRRYGVPETTIFRDTDLCYTLGSSTIVSYCYVSSTQEVTRQFAGGTVSTIGDSIATFDLVKPANSPYVDLYIESVSDFRGQENEIDVRLYIRN